MDAATLYVIVTMSDGTQTTSTLWYPSLRACAASMEFLKDVARADREAPIQGYWCVGNKQTVRLYTCGWRARGCEDIQMASRQGCTALKWVMVMRNRNRTGTCYVGDKVEGDETSPQPDPSDGKNR